jgi:integrase
VQQDHSGTKYLKIPLGKMNNERLVPLDLETLELIQKIREQGDSEREDAGIVVSGPKKLVYGQAHPSSFCSDIRDAFREITTGLVTPEPLRLHRLRHTFATEMLNAGMSLYGVMHLLGHRHVGTTLIYAAITQVTVREEFFSALEKLKTKYMTDKGPVAGPAADLTPIALADDLARSLRRLRGAGKPGENAQIQRLLKRLDHIRDELKDLA